MVFAWWMHSQEDVNLHQLHCHWGTAVAIVVKDGCVWAARAGRRGLGELELELHSMAASTAEAWFQRRRRAGSDMRSNTA